MGFHRWDKYRYKLRRKKETSTYETVVSCLISKVAYFVSIYHDCCLYCYWPGVTKQVGDALLLEGQQRTGRVVSIGIAPWGIVERNHELLGHNRDVPCHSISSPRFVHCVSIHCSSSQFEQKPTTINCNRQHYLVFVYACVLLAVFRTDPN